MSADGAERQAAERKLAESPQQFLALLIWTYKGRGNAAAKIKTQAAQFEKRRSDLAKVLTRMEQEHAQLHRLLDRPRPDVARKLPLPDPLVGKPRLTPIDEWGSEPCDLSTGCTARRYSLVRRHAKLVHDLREAMSRRWRSAAALDLGREETRALASKKGMIGYLRGYKLKSREIAVLFLARWNPEKKRFTETEVDELAHAVDEAGRGQPSDR